MGGVRRRGGVNLIWASMGNYGNLSFRCQGRILRGRGLKGESTDAENRGGATRTSEEVPVMGMEKRGCVRMLVWRATGRKFRRICWIQRQGKSLDPDGSGVSREAHAPFCEGLAGKFRWPTLPSTLRSERSILFYNPNHHACKIFDGLGSNERGIFFPSRYSPLHKKIF